MNTSKPYLNHNLKTLGLGSLLTLGLIFSAHSQNTPQAGQVAFQTDEPSPHTTQLSTPDAEDVIGRWNLTLDKNGKEAPSWLEVKLSGFKVLTGHFVGDDGSARPISKVHFENGKVSFSIPPQWQNTDQDLVFEGMVNNGEMTGTILHPMGDKYSFVGKPAPSLVREKAPEWAEPIAIFNGNDLSGWYADNEHNQWKVVNGILTSEVSGANLITEEKFDDFKLEVEFRYPEGSNSGIFLRGRYEVQIQDDKGKEASSVLFGGVYGFLTPNEMVAKAAGEWQTFEITLVGRRLTIVANGKNIICDQIIPGITGGALDSHEALPGPIMLQGDHGPVEFRKIVLTPGK
ncbi:3-keto-disaccharide hydrolase [Arthrospiribacter ruber]|uniref:DUF1080 domain-containing protein n=1 Tax=Arthrospiribacter ruber TaxID=2487934 RepID=A0A951MHM5_9BACT|nr:DUF1080 domain-containing protein [Arthrospiribacter ruber]MBW3469476.1 DUF1080 domain-containing protein [Arthrospiribacter ruber]